MKRWFPQVLIAIISWLALISFVASAQPVAWVTSSLQRTGQTDPAGSGTQAQLSAGKGEYESFQIVVRGPASGLSNVNVTVSDLTGPGGAIIPKTSFNLYSEHYVYVSSSSPNWGGSNQPMGAGWYPDGLVPFTDPATGASLSGSGAALVAVPFNLNANTNQPIWVDLLVPRTAVAGQYSGTFTVTSNQGNTSGTISLTVWNFTLPLKSTLRSTFLYWNTGNLAADEELLRNKIEPLREAVSEQSTLMSGFGLGDIGLPFWSGADASTCTMSAAPSTSQIQTSVASQQSGLAPYIYSADEIGGCSSLVTIMQQWGYNMHQAGVNNLVTMAPTLALLSDGSGTGRSAVDFWTMLPVTYDGATSLVAQALAKGDSAWSYNALVQDSYSPKWLIDFAPMNFRIQPGFISQSLGLTGILYWKVDGWNATDPWNQVNNAGVFSSSNYPGEGQFVYPGTQVGISGVAPSMRLKWLRDGVQDYEYVALLKAAGQGSQALTLAQSVGANWTTWTRDPNQLTSVRQQLGQLLDQLGGGPPTAPSAPSLSSPSNGATGVSQTQALSWSASTGATSYDVYFGASSPPVLVTNTTSTSYAPAGLNASTTYYWQIIAKNSVGTASSAIWPFTTAASSSVPPKPVNPSPASGATGVSLNPVLSWGAATGATSYDVYFGTTSTSLVATVTGTTYTPSTLAASTTYMWGVVAKDSAGSNSSVAWTFTTGAAAPPPPAAPANPNPATGATAVGLSPTLGWSASANATSYDVYFGTSASPGFVTNTTGTTYAPGALAVTTTYRWKVVAKNSAGSTSSTTWSFTTDAPAPPPPAAAANPNPANGATGISSSPTLGWSASANATSYDVYFGTSSSPAFVANTTGTTYAPGALTNSNTYSWKVVAKNSASSTSSATWTFTTSAPPPPPPAAPANPNPASGASGVGSSPTLGWSPSANATSYDVYFGTSSPAFVANTTGTTYAPGALASSTTYSWKVVAKNNSGTASSAVWTFTTSTPAPIPPTSVSATPNSGTGRSETLTLSYSDGNGFTDIGGAGAMINATLNGVNACWFYYDRSSNTLSLASDSTSTWTALPPRGTVQNSQCTISSATASGSGNTFNLTVVITYTRAFAGTRNIYGYVRNKAGLSSGYQPLGSWRVINH